MIKYTKMKEIHTHNCTYEHINENYIGGYKTRYIGLYDDNNSGLFYINFLEEYKQDEIISMTKSCADEIVNRQLYEVVELMEILFKCQIISYVNGYLLTSSILRIVKSKRLVLTPTKNTILL